MNTITKRILRMLSCAVAIAPALCIADDALQAQHVWGQGKITAPQAELLARAPRALPVETVDKEKFAVTAPAADAGRTRVPRAIPATLGWGPPLRMSDRPKVTDQAVGPGKWANEYRLGPGDVLNLALRGSPISRKNGVEIGPDGTLSYLQARRVAAKGLTVPQLRKALEKGLAEHHEDPHMMISPVHLRSKRYTILGKVRKSGNFPLARPTTLLEAIARSGGFLVGSTRLSISELADLRRSFVVRAGKKLEIDMERLYSQGDLTQNAFLEPGDYIYIASNVEQHCYVLGSVVGPGEVPLDTPLTIVGAIAAAGGFGEKAWKKRVLIVRGNLSDPNPEVVDIREILHGGTKDVAVQPGDIVYVSDRPWSLAEDLLDAAIRSFIQGSAAAAFETRTSISISR